MANVFFKTGKASAAGSGLLELSAFFRAYSKGLGAVQQKSKTRIFIDEDHFFYHVNEPECRRLGIPCPSRNAAVSLSEATKKGLPIHDHGEILIKERIPTASTKDARVAAEKVEALTKFILAEFEADNSAPHKNKKWLSTIIDKFHNPEKYLPKEQKVAKRNKEKGFFDLMDEYLQRPDLSDVRKKNFRSLERILQRYELFVRATDPRRKNFKLDVRTMDKYDIADLEDFLRNEHTLAKDYPKIFASFPPLGTKRRSRAPEPRGRNTICTAFGKLRAFFHWCIAQGVTTNFPFNGYTGVNTEKYGTPYYITIEERNAIAAHDLESRPALAVQRDIFVFHCLVGCRVSDLMRLTEDNVIDGEINYIAHKTMDEAPNVIKVPLGKTARALVEKYRGQDPDGRLFPFITPQKYNDAIKEVLTVCGITRKVTILDPVTGEEVQRPINEVASSHMARRTFVGNLYKKVKDPNLIAPMSGHTEGSKAFARYREIDQEIRQEMINLLD